MQEVRSGGSYISQSDLRLHFGLAGAKKCELEVRWPTGQVEKFADVAADRIIRIVEGKGIVTGGAMAASGGKLNAGLRIDNAQSHRSESTAHDGRTRP
jgi:hypothetical protein